MKKSPRYLLGLALGAAALTTVSASPAFAVRGDVYANSSSSKQEQRFQNPAAGACHTITIEDADRITNYTDSTIRYYVSDDCGQNGRPDEVSFELLPNTDSGTTSFVFQSFKVVDS